MTAGEGVFLIVFTEALPYTDLISLVHTFLILFVPVLFSHFPLPPTVSHWISQTRARRFKELSVFFPAYPSTRFQHSHT